MLYPKNNEKLSPELFGNPTAEYRGTPFWAWNCKLDQELLNEEIDHMKTMGLGGFHMHSRSGLATPYLSDEFMGHVKACVEKAKSNQMLAWLYDEDRWPSGFGGGLVTQDEKYRQRYLLFTPTPYGQGELQSCTVSHAATGRSEKGYLLATYSISLDENGCLSEYRRLSENEKAEGKLWYAYIETPLDNPWFNNASYVDTLNPEAIRKFIEITHERYYEAVGDEFGKSIPAIFTDEPQTSRKQTLGFAEEERDVALPFTDNFTDSFKSIYGFDLLDKLPELYWELPDGKVSTVRYFYHDHLSERFSSAFADEIGSWCKAHNIMMTGHMMSEQTLQSQTADIGEAMRSYRGFQLPGIDLLGDQREFATAKQAQSASHQFGCPGVLSELYGVTGWDFDFRGHKLQGDWQAALGITVRVHHLYWVSMAGEAKRDYPACIGHQSAWFKEYAYIEDHFARVSTAMTRGKPRVRVGVIHPIESYWLHWGPSEQTSSIREEMDRRFSSIIEWLLYGTIDFDLICESLLPSQYQKSDDGFQVGEMNYDTVIVPFCETIRCSTLAALTEYVNQGGRVIFAGEPPKYVDAVLSDEPAKLAARAVSIPFSEGYVLNAIEDLREIDIRDMKGARANNLFYQSRIDDKVNYLFISHVNIPKNQFVSHPEKYKITLKGEFKPMLYDTLSGEISDCSALLKNGKTIIEWSCSCHDSLLLTLEQGKPVVAPMAEQTYSYVGEVKDKVSVTLLEPNSLVLDIAEFALDGGQWEQADEILRLDDTLHIRLGYPTRNTGYAQPWSVPYVAPTHELKLRFTIHSEIDVLSASLALEDAESVTISMNGQLVPSIVTGYFTDKSIKTVSLPKVPAGESQIVITMPYGPKTDVEWCYILGDFGVEVNGRHCTITSPVHELSFDDWTKQGLPFYSGNLIYHCSIEGNDKEIKLEVPQFHCPAVTVEVDGQRKGIIALSPYTLLLGKLSIGSHKLDLTVQNSRINAFGAMHNCDDKESWLGPNAWRNVGNRWCYEYRVKKSGIVIAPRVYTEE